MLLTIDLPDYEVKRFVKDLMDNLPEYSLNLECTKWDYKNEVFKFFDDEDGKEYTITIDDVVKKGFPLFLNFYSKIDHNGRSNGLSSIVALAAEDFDAFDVDMLVQFTIFGARIYA